MPSKVNSYKNNPCCFHLFDANIWIKPVFLKRMWKWLLRRRNSSLSHLNFNSNLPRRWSGAWSEHSEDFKVKHFFVLGFIADLGQFEKNTWWITPVESICTRDVLPALSRPKNAWDGLRLILSEVITDLLRLIEKGFSFFSLFSPDVLSCWKGRGRRAKIEASQASTNSTFCLNSLP